MTVYVTSWIAKVDLGPLVVGNMVPAEVTIAHRYHGRDRRAYRGHLKRLVRRDTASWGFVVRCPP